MKKNTTNIWSVANDTIPKKYYSIEDIAKAINNEGRMTTWHFLRVKKIIHSNGFANEEWLKQKLCFCKKNDLGDYDTFFNEEGYNKVIEMWKNTPNGWG